MQRVFVYDSESERKAFLEQKVTKIAIPGTSKTINYNPEAKTVIMHSKLGANKAIQLGAYVFALNQLNNLVNKL